MSANPARTWAPAVIAIGVGVALFAWYFAEDGYSNIYPDDYVGPNACVECHEKSHQETTEIEDTGEISCWSAL